MMHKAALLSLTLLVICRAAPTDTGRQGKGVEQDASSPYFTVIEQVPLPIQAVERGASSSAIHQGQSIDSRREYSGGCDAMSCLEGRYKDKRSIVSNEAQDLKNRFEVTPESPTFPEIARYEEIKDTIRHEDLVNIAMQHLPNNSDRQKVLSMIQLHGNYKTHLALLEGDTSDQSAAVRYLKTKYKQG